MESKHIKYGIFYANDQSCILYNMQNDQLHGKNFIVYPSGICMSASYEHGKLNRWVISIFKGHFIVCYNYRRGMKEGEQYFYDIKDKLLIVSFYSRGVLR